MNYTQAAVLYTQKYPTIKYLQIGNESDHVSDSSWTMSKDDLNSLISAFSSTGSIYPRYLIGPGLVSGQPDYLDGIDLTPLTAIAVHPYAQWPNTVGNLLDGYRRFNKPIVITEFGWPEPDWKAQAQWFGEFCEALYRAGVTGIINYCWDDEQNPNFGIMHKGKWKDSAYVFKDFITNTQPTVIVPPKPPEFVLGFKQWHDAEPDLIGDPKENERPTYVRGFSQQWTTNGLFSWADLKSGQAMTFNEHETMDRYFWDGSKGVKY